MKTYKTWEVFKALAENPNREFKRESDNLQINITFLGSYRWDTNHSYLNINNTWVEELTSVNFMEAMGAYQKGKTIVCKGCDGRGNKCELRYNTDTGLSSITSDAILNGKWYVQEGGDE